MSKFVVLSFLVLVLLVGCASSEREPVKKIAKVAVKTEVVESRQVEDILEFPGVVRAKSQSRLSFATGGRLISREVQVGDVVKMGDLIARLDQKGFSIGVSAASASLKARKEQRDQLLRDAKRARQLDRDGAFTKSNLEKVESALVQAESGLQASKQALRESQRMRGESRLRAPFAGVITTVYAQAGEVIGAGRPVVRLVGHDGAEVIIEVSSDVIPRISTDEKVVLFTNNGGKINATIDNIIGSATTESGLHPVIISLPKDANTTDGADVRVRIETAPKKSTLIPLSAIVDPSGQQPFVWVVIEGRVKKVKIKLGSLYGQFMSVQDLAEGSVIVAVGQGRLLEDDEISTLTSVPAVKGDAQ